MVALAMRYSFVIPVYNRPEELEELLGSIVQLRGIDAQQPGGSSPLP